MQNLNFLFEFIAQWIKYWNVLMGSCADPGGVLHGPGLSCGYSLPPLQNPQGRVSGSAGSLSRSPVRCKVGTTGVSFTLYDGFVTVTVMHFLFFNWFNLKYVYRFCFSCFLRRGIRFTDSSDLSLYFLFQWYPSNGFHERRRTLRPRPLSLLRGLHR